MSRDRLVGFALAVLVALALVQALLWVVDAALGSFSPLVGALVVLLVVVYAVRS